jgi:hypothetical protein
MPNLDACARCGRQVYRTRTSRAEIVCRECRRKQPVHRKERATRSCKWCGKDFQEGLRASYRLPQEFCSRSCAASFGNRQRSAHVTAEQSCEICGKQFKPTRHDKPQRTCSRTCGAELRRGDDAYRERQQWPMSLVYIRECAWCGTLFVGRTVRSWTCCRDHGRRLNWSKSNQARRVTEHRCPCGASIQPSRNKCDDCLSETRRERRRKERARKRESMAAEPYTLAEIAARDRYRCGICIAEGRSRQARVAMTKAVPHPRAPTIDHVVPWSISKDDTRANVQLAHFLCNSRKCTGGSQQLALIG